MEFISTNLLRALLFVSLCQRTISSESNRTVYDLIYIRHGIDSDSSTAFCIGRFNATHQFGCHNAAHSQVGPLYAVQQATSFVTNIGKLHAQTGSTFILLVDVLDFDSVVKIRSNLSEISVYTSGIIFYRRLNSQFPASSYQSYSHESRCPESYFGSFAQPSTLRGCEKEFVSTKNPFFDYAFTKWPFPMFYISNQTLIDQLIKCGKNRRNGNTQCLVELKSKMHGAINSKRCIERSNNVVDRLISRSWLFCNRVSSYNFFSSLIPVLKNQSIANRSIILVTARLDSFTVFNTFFPASHAVYTGVIVLIATARLLNKYRQQIEQKANDRDINFKNVQFALFDRESFGYIGSSSWLYYTNFYNDKYSEFYDFDRAFGLNNFAFVLELNQLLSNGGQHWIHWDKVSKNGARLFAENLMRFADSNRSVRFAPSNTTTLPPSTIRTFRALDPELPVALLGGYNDRFGANFHSLFDIAKPNEIKEMAIKLNQLTLILTKFLYFLLTKEEKQNFDDDFEFVHNLTICLLISSTQLCHLFNEEFDPKKFVPHFNENPHNHNKNDAPHTNDLQAINDNLRQSIFTFLAYANSFETVCNSSSKPLKDYQFILERGPLNDTIDRSANRCLYSQTWTRGMSSPYLDDIENGNTKVADWLVTRNATFEFSSLTESNFDSYRQPAILIFIRPSTGYEMGIVSIGLFMSILSTALTIILDRNSHRLFEPSSAANAESKEAITSNT